MERLIRYQWHIFWLSCAVIGAAMILRLAALAPLYTDTQLRSRTQTLIQATAAREGWLLSGLRIESISSDHLRLLYRSYLRGDDPLQCFDLSLSSGRLTPCPLRPRSA